MLNCIRLGLGAVKNPRVFEEIRSILLEPLYNKLTHFCQIKHIVHRIYPVVHSHYYCGESIKSLYFVLSVTRGGKHFCNETRENLFHCQPGTQANSSKQKWPEIPVS